MIETSPITKHLKELQIKIINSFETLEDEKKFTLKPWEYTKGSGGGRMGIIKGDVFEKAAVHFSAVSGDALPFKESLGPFFASGVSLITHMHNPYAPTVHMNVRFIQTKDRFWFGGGYDLTPMGFPFEEDRLFFHNHAKSTLDPFGEELYDTFSKNAAEYFYIPHRKKERGVGGIFFDYFQTGNFEKDLAMWKAVGDSFTDAIMPIYTKRISMPYTEKEKAIQNKLRAHYVEFNLVYDRGTKFGFQSGGNPESILSSMPPTATW